MTQENTTPKKTKVEIIEAMQRLYTEISSIDEQIADLKNEAKERGMPHSLMARVAKLRADAKIDETLDKNDEFAALVEEVRGN